MGAKIKEEHQLKGADDWAQWDRAVQLALGEEGLIEHIFQPPEKLVEEVNEDYPLSSPATSAETSRRNVALRSLKRDRGAAFAVIYNGLSETVQNKLADDLASFAEPKPKGLYDHLKKSYGAGSLTRQVEL